MFTLFLVAMTLVWAAMFVLPLVAYAAVGLKLITSEKANKGSRINRNKPALHMTVSHA